MVLALTTTVPVGIYNGWFGGTVTPYISTGGGTATTSLVAAASGMCQALLPGQINADGTTSVVVYSVGTASTALQTWSIASAGPYFTGLIVGKVGEALVLQSSTTQNLTCSNLFVETFDPTKGACQL
jgi:hypothetical protein